MLSGVRMYYSKGLLAFLLAGAGEIPETGHAEGPRCISGHRCRGKAPTVTMGSEHIRDGSERKEANSQE